MSDELRRTLRVYEAEYPGQPLVARRADLEAINRLRAQLGLPLVDAELKEIGAVAEAAAPEPPPPPAPDHSTARELYRAYLAKVKELRPHRAYADRVARATSGPGQTPVGPLTTMGTGGGPLLCDQCKKPIVLEGGAFQGVPADAAWAKNPDPEWKSWISGGLVVEIVTNGTLRIYHGYPGRDDRQCCNAARRADEQAQKRHAPPPGHEPFHALRAFLEHEFPERSERDRVALVNDILNTVFSYDPGIGVNRPDGPG
ncbi:unnamed protein product [Gemmataceae bacterium]|nr:unnamed protein product [Gemmataceae bacterium]VTU00294.1 unnamed protein product [Gemmataceae bacterium]